MIEAGLVKKINADTAVAAIMATLGGYSGVPEKGALPTWTYRWVTNPVVRGLTTPVGLSLARVQIDCYGNSGDEVLRLSEAIYRVLNGFRGSLADADATYVDSIFRSDLHDSEEDAAGRTWRRVSEYEVNYAGK